MRLERPRSSSVPYGMIDRTGPKISSCAMVILLSTSSGDCNPEAKSQEVPKLCSSCFRKAARSLPDQV